MYQLKEDVFATRGNVRVGLVRQTPFFDEPRAPRGETEFVRRPLGRLVVVVVFGACVVVAIGEQTRDDVRRERRAQVWARSEALEERRPDREQSSRRIVRALRRHTFPISYHIKNTKGRD